MDSTSSYLAFIAYELYIAAMCCVSTIVFLSLSPLSFTAFYSMLLVEKRSNVLLCFLCFNLFLMFLFRIDDDDSLKEKDQSNSSKYRRSPFYHEPRLPSPTPPWRSKSSSPPVTTNPISQRSSQTSYKPSSRRSKRNSLSPTCSQPVTTNPQPSPASSSPAYSQPSPPVTTHSQPSPPSSSPAYSQPSPPVTTNRPIPIYHEPPSSTPPRRSKQSSSSPAFHQPPSPAPPRRSKRRLLSPAFYQPPSSAPPRRSKRSSQSPESSYLPSTLSFMSPPPRPPFKMKDWKYIREGDYVRMASEVSLSSDSDTSDINVRSDRFIAENKKRFRDEIREDQQLRF